MEAKTIAVYETKFGIQEQIKANTFIIIFAPSKNISARARESPGDTLFFS